MAMDSGMLQNKRATNVRWRKPWRSVNQAAAYPGKTVSGAKAGMARKLPASWEAVIDWRIEMLSSHSQFGRDG